MNVYRVLNCVTMAVCALRAFSIVPTSFFSTRVSTVQRIGLSPFRPTLVSIRCFNVNDVYLPLDKLEFNYARSSGPGGQNVNKLNTKAEVRFNVHTADWLEPEVKQRLLEYQSNKISKEGDLIVSSQEHRMQGQNKEDCFRKLKQMIAEASIAPKDRNMYEGISEKGKERRKDEKRKRGEVKEGRRAKNSKNLFD